MTDFRQKEESVPTAASGATSPNAAGFRRDLEELVLEHIDGCKTYAAACSSGRDDLEDDGESVSGEGSDQLIRRRRRSDLEGGEMAESSAARRRHSRILSRWVARQAEDMITTMERRNRESELMALAGLQTVSMLDSSFLRESIRPSPVTPEVSVDLPAVPRSSSILRRWREIEDESARSPRRSLAQNREDRDRILDSRVSTSGSEENDYGHWSHQSIGTSREQRDEEDGGGRSTREQSPDSVDGERERVRQIARGRTSNLAEQYKTLKIQPGSSEMEVKKAFRQLALQYHPDVCNGKNSGVHFSRINEAYHVVMKNLRDDSPEVVVEEYDEEEEVDDELWYDESNWELWNEYSTQFNNYNI